MSLTFVDEFAVDILAPKIEAVVRLQGGLDSCPFGCAVGTFVGAESGVTYVRLRILAVGPLSVCSRSCVRLLSTPSYAGARSR